MQEKSFIENIDFSKSDQYTLSIRLSTDGFSFSIYNPINDNSLSFFKHPIQTSIPIGVNIKKILGEVSIMQYQYKKINVLQTSNRYILTPLELYDEEQQETFFLYNHSKQENEIYIDNTIKSINANVTFGFDKNAYELLSNHFEKVNFYSISTVLIEHFARKSRLGNTLKMYVYIRKNTIDIYCLERNKLLFANSFTCRHDNDRIYYMLYLWKQLYFNQEKDELHIVGTINDKEKLVDNLKKYIRKVFIINPKSELNVSTEVKINEVPFDLQVLSTEDILY